MVQLIILLLGLEFIKKRAKSILLVGFIWIISGLVVFIDALDGILYFPIHVFAWILLLEGLATLVFAWTGVGGQRMLRLVKGSVVVLVAILVFSGSHGGNFLLSILLGTVFFVDGLLQCISSWMVRYRRWKIAFIWGTFEILVAVFFFQPYPTDYAGTLPYGLGILLIFGGIHLLTLASRVRRLKNIGMIFPRGTANLNDNITSGQRTQVAKTEWDGPPRDDEKSLVIHVWTPTGSSKAPTQNYPLIDRYIAAVDVTGVISTGHAALESPEGIYISLYPAVEIDRSPDDFGKLLRASTENDVPGIFQPDYETESKAWCSSTVQVKIRNYDPVKLESFWSEYRLKKIYNLTHRNCSSSVANALEAAINGAIFRLHGDQTGWMSFIRIMVTPELWVAAQIRKRAVTMAWTPGLTLDYARALSMLVDPRPFGWLKVARSAVRLMSQRRKEWRARDQNSC